MTPATKKSAPQKASAQKTATKSAAKETPAQKEERTAQEDRADAKPATTSAGAVTEPAASSEEAMQARKAAPHAPASVGGAASVEQADDLKPISFAPDPYPPNPAALDNQKVMESRRRAKLVGDSVAQQSDVGRGTQHAGKAEVRTGTRQVGSRVVEPETVEYSEVAIPTARGELVFRENGAGQVEVAWNRPDRINALSGPPAFEVIATLTQAQWDALDELKLSSKEQAAQAQSAAEQRQGVAKEGGDPGPAAPTPVTLG